MSSQIKCKFLEWEDITEKQYSTIIPWASLHIWLPLKLGHVASSGEYIIRRDMSHLGQSYDKGVCGWEFSHYYDIHLFEITGYSYSNKKLTKA